MTPSNFFSGTVTYITGRSTYVLIIILMVIGVGSSCNKDDDTPASTMKFKVNGIPVEKTSYSEFYVFAGYNTGKAGTEKPTETFIARFENAGIRFSIVVNSPATIGIGTYTYNIFNEIDIDMGYSIDSIYYETDYYEPVGKVVFTTVTDKNVKGTFEGTLVRHPDTLLITEGFFDLYVY